MAAPNLASPATITGKTAAAVIGSTAAAVLSNTAGSGKLLSVNAIMVANVDGATAYTVTIDHYRSSTAIRLAYQVSVPAGATLDVISRVINLEEGDSLRFTGSTANKLEALVCYDEIA